jgi:hypothetical protein
MFLSFDVHTALCFSRYVPQFLEMFLSHKHMLLGSWLRNICLFPVVFSSRHSNGSLIRDHRCCQW